jgi:hypothetical protein
MFKKILFISLLLFCATAFATSNGARPGHVATPAEGFVKTALLMGNGIVDPNQLIIFDMSYHTDIRKRSTEQIAAHRALAIAHFEDTFEIDVAALESQGKVVFSPFILTDDMQYRVFSMSDIWVPSAGFQMADGGWLLMVTDPSGITVNGDTLIPSGSMSVYGEYFIMAENIAGKSQEPVIVHYQSDRFIITGFYGETPILCDVFHPDWGWGKAQGVALMFPEGDGMNANTRNVFTFAGDDHSKPHHAVWFE